MYRLTEPVIVTEEEPSRLGAWYHVSGARGMELNAKVIKRTMLERVLRCPRCRQELNLPPLGQNGPVMCGHCGQVGRVQEHQILFNELGGSGTQDDWFARVKNLAKGYLASWYPAVVRTVSPVFAPNWAKRFLRRFAFPDQLVADLGCGLSVYPQPVILVDGAPYRNVDVVCLLENLPFVSESFDGLISVAVLEHLAEPELHLQEMWRVLKPAGQLLLYVPFLQGYHGSPGDFRRWTIEGMRKLLKDWEITDIGVGAGPTSALVWVLQEWLAIALSVRSRLLYRLLYILSHVLSPLKWLDVIISGHPEAFRIASAIVAWARKPG